ncbi:hypothetical protein B0H17DRAFT_1058552 [Mycena rosella]|uniref:F-box domain-containing protein n=1 Tax=Mycena rosella TaxID=1033263 RepID=A0AAD7DL68_MYCRO|nr:hypothetical protein B0H17DRAFT_1058552 [Mycena rosella]
MQAQLEDLKRELNSIVYPVLTLPPEISSEIFLHCIPSTRRLDVVNIDEAPLLLMRACSAWREIAVSTPALWSTLDINFAKNLPPHHSSEIVDTWLSRARLCPLSVTIISPWFGISDLVPFLESLRRHPGGMRSLELNLILEDYKRMAKHRMSFPLLQNLTIRLTQNENPGSICVGTFDNVPMLHELLMDFLSPSFIILPWQQITKFTAGWYTLVECSEALHLMPNIMECRFVTRFNSDDGVPSDSISHPKYSRLLW